MIVQARKKLIFDFLTSTKQNWIDFCSKRHQTRDLNSLKLENFASHDSHKNVKFASCTNAHFKHI